MVKTIKNIRLKSYDYSTNGFYFITLCSNYRSKFTQNERSIIVKYLGEPIHTGSETYADESATANFADKSATTGFIGIKGAQLDYYELVDNHLHFILILDSCRFKLGEIIRRFKAKTSRESKRQLWQPNYHEHVIRKEESLSKIREYIKNNPLKESMDFDKI